MAVSLLSSIVITLSLIGFFIEFEPLLYVIVPLFVVNIVSSCNILYKYSTINNNFFWPSNILLISIIIVCFQTLLNIYWGIAPFNQYLPIRYANLLIPCTYIGILSITSLQLGLRIKLPLHYKDKLKNYILWPWGLLLPILFYFFIINIDLVSFITGSSYMGSGGFDRESSKSEYFEQLLEVVFVIITSIVTQRLLKEKNVSLKKFLKSFPIVYWIILSSYIFLRMLSGDRGPVLYSSCLVFYSFLMCSKYQFKPLFIIGIFITSAAVVTILGIARTGELNLSFVERVNDAILSDHETKPSIFNPTQELANSINTEFIAVHAMNNSNENFKFGKYTFFALISSIPGSSWIISNIFDVDLRSTMSPEYITTYEKGPLYNFGLGTSPMAEFYLEFGIIGCIFGFFLLGILFKWVNMIIFGYNTSLPIWAIIISLKLASISVYIARASVGSCLAKALYTIIVFYLFNFIFKFLKKSKNNLPIKL